MKRTLISISVMGAKLWNNASVHNVKIINIYKQIIENMFISLCYWHRCWGMFVILFTVQMQHIWYKMPNNILLL